ncbi:MAG: carboxypeptidase-like regulatory domain-containing protein, partial [Vicinamibacterales bacterium]
MTGRRVVARPCLWMVVVLVGVVPAYAQVGAGALTGVVSDQSGGAVSGASITVTALATNRASTTTSSRDGGYLVAGLAPGEYGVRFDIAGFRTLDRRAVRVATGETVRLDASLTIGAVSDAVSVVGDASLLRSASASLGQVIGNQTIAALPLNGRNFITLAGLVPGVALPPNSSLPRINGGRPRTNEYLFDGISVLQPEPGQVAFFPNIDAVQEFKIETNSPPAEFGRFNGGVVNLTTKSGTNALHGTGFDFLRNEALNARNVFASTNPAKPKYRRNQFGGVLGGPARKDRTFFFVDYQGQRQTIGRTMISTVPTLLQRQGVFTEAIGGRVPVIFDPATTVGNVRTQFAGSTIPANRIDPVALALLTRYPLPTGSGTANNFQRVGDEVQDQDQFSVRLDQQFADNRDHIFGRL